MNDAFLDLLREVIGVLEPFSTPFVVPLNSPTPLTWESFYSPHPKFDPYAAMLRTLLSTIAEMLDKQGAPPSPAQMAYVRVGLFGGSGSLRDFLLNERLVGPEARQANQELERLTKELHEQFRSLESPGD